MEQLHTMQQYSGNNATDHNYYSHETHYHEPPKIEPEIHQQHFSSHQHFYHAEPDNSSNSSYYDLVTGNFKNSPTGETLISKDVNEQELSQAEMANLKGWSNVQPLQSLQGNTQHKVQSQVRSRVQGQVHCQVEAQSRIQSHANQGHHYNQNVKTEYIQNNMQNGNNHVQNGQNYQNGRIKVQQQQSQFQIKSEIQHFQNNGQHNGPIYGHASGKINGHLNGHQNGHYNGHHNGHHNGHQNSHQNGHHDGRYQNGHHTGNQHNYPNSGHNVTKTNNSNHQSNQPPQFQPQVFTNYEESETSSSMNSPNPNSPSINYAERPDQDEAGRFNCKKCEKSFKTQTTLYQHMRVKHAANRRRQVNCDLCKLQFPIKEKLLKHYDSAMHVLCEDNPEYLAAFHQHINYSAPQKIW